MNTENLIFPLNAKDIQLYAYARIAFLNGLKLIGFKRGDFILLPELICNSICDVLSFLGVRARFYRVGERLEADLDNIRDLIRSDKIKAVLAVNYFGFPQKNLQIKEICREKNIYFIEDNAQGFLSKDNNVYLGSFGDISIFSFRKTLNLPYGAALVVNNASLKKNNHAVEIRYKSPLWEDLQFVLKSAGKKVLSRNNMGFRLKEYIRLKRLKRGHTFKKKEDLEYYFIRYSPLVNFFLNRTDFNSVIEARREAFLFYHNYFSARQLNCNIIFDNLKEGVAPSCFPIWTDSDRMSLIKDLSRRRISSFYWPDLPKELNKRGDLSRIIAVDLK